MIGSGDVSLLAVRNDLDLAGDFSLRTNAAGKNKATWDDTTDLRLSEYRKNVLGQQEIKSNSNTRANWRGVGGTGSSSVIDVTNTPDSQIRFPNKPSATKMIYGRNIGSEFASDTFSEMRHFGRHAGGNHKLSVHVQRLNNNSGLHYSKISVVCNSANYLSGAQTIAHDDRWGYGTSWLGYEKTINLPADKPYVTVIIYTISPANSDSYKACEVKYNCLQLDKI
jgi:hypothetical protein